MSEEKRELRVLYIARAPFVSGAERALISMLRSLDRQQVVPGLVIGHESSLRQDAEKLGVKVLMVPWGKRELGKPLEFFKWWRSLSGLRKVVDEFQPQVLHANDVPSCQAMSVVGAERNIPRVVHVRWTIKAQDASWWARKGCEGVICISQWMRAQLGEVAGTNLARAKVEVIHDAVDWAGNGIDKDGSPRSSVDAAGASTLERGLRGPKVTIGFAGQLIPSKGLDLVIRAMGELRVGERPRLLVAGKDAQKNGQYERELRELATQKGVQTSIEWLGFLENVKELYEQVDAMVCPSREEPLGLVPLEAAEFGLPTIANRVGGLAETIMEGATGWLVQRQEVDAWAAALRQLQDGAALSRMGQAARARTMEHFSPRVYQTKLMALYDAMTQAKKQM